MWDALIRNLECRDILSDEERLAIQRLPARLRAIPAGGDITSEGESPGESSIIIEGFAARSKILAQGKRQLTAFHIAGDFVDLHSLLLRSMDHSVVALTDCAVANVSHGFIRQIDAAHPHLGRVLWLTTLVDAAIHRQWIVAMGRRSSAGQVAHIFCELFLRLKAVNLTAGFSYRLPITQEDLSDAMGLSVVHVNRTLRRLRMVGLMTWRDQIVTIHDLEQLKQIAEFDPEYLNLTPSPR